MKLIRYSEFINESFFRKLRSKKNKINYSDKIENCKNEIISFLEENGVFSWNDFEKMNTFKREVVNKIIDKSVDTLNDVKEVIFRIRLHLSNPLQLREYVKELEYQEEYEKCAKILQKIR
jgi:hypothetical protein